MQISMKSFPGDEAEMKKSECVVRLRIRENDVKSQMWRLMTNNSFEAVTDVEQEISKIFQDLDAMIIDLFDAIQGVHSRRPDESLPKDNEPVQNDADGMPII